MSATVLIIEDHPMFRDALVQLVCATLEITTVAASSAEEGLRIAPTLREVKLVLLDPGLPGMKGAEAITAFGHACPGAQLVAISASEERREAMAALRAGAKVFVSKAVTPEALGTLLRRVVGGEVARPEWVTPQGTGSLDDVTSLVLTPRQREILALLAQGHSNKEIGLRLDLAEITVKMHVSALFRALGVANRTQAVLAARRLGL
ncbi:MAG: LuxR C-terminal-related transcriptional regulator [Burkholderiales bacterium]